MKSIGAFVVTTLLLVEQHAYLTQAAQINKGQGNSSCLTQKVFTEPAHSGWPHSFSCDQTIIYDEFSEEWTCVLTDAGSGEVIFNNTWSSDDIYDTKHFLHKVHPNHSNNYYLDLVSSDQGTCYRYVYRLNVSELEEMTCHESMTNYSPWHEKTELDKVLILECFTGEDDPHPIHAQSGHNHTVVWRRNCTDIKNITGVEINDKNEMVISQVSYDHPGVYSCAYVINGQERFAFHQKICVKPKISKGLPKIKCLNTRHRVVLGQPLLIECVLDLGNGYAQAFDHALKWKKVRGVNVTNVCMNNAQGKTMNGTESRLHCNFTTKYPCFLHVPSKEERAQSRFTTTVRFWIDNVQEADLGTYVVAVRKQRIEMANDTFLLELDQEPHVISINYIVLICLSCFVLFLIVVCFLCWHRFYICLYYKRNFGKYETDDKKYGAFISYHFSTEMDKFAQQQTRDATAATLSNLESLGYRVYDENRDGFQSEMRVDSSMNAMRQCHRVVIVLTPEYLKDHWSIFCLQKSFHSMIESNHKMIFVIVPGTREYIKQHSNVDETHLMIRRALKLNHDIQWSENRNFDKRRFKLELEWAMPKLATQRSVRHESTTSSLLSQQYTYTNGFHRTMSVETEVTEAGSPKPAGEQFTCFVIEPETCPSNTSL
uniref:Uncharacterized protein LOC100175496 n=1 Tax=Phallusia mammillata TaxID=59560 RepID=A0A6F9DH16_9ASCI|nr:uncharacterized protein LOC100175496 [Phallusia mammillata]